MRWKDVKVFQEIELGAGRALTQCGLVKSQRQDSVAQNSRVFLLSQPSISAIVNSGHYWHPWGVSNQRRSVHGLFPCLSRRLNARNLLGCGRVN